MKKKIVQIISCLMLVVSLCFTATGCGYSENEAINPEPGWNQDDNDDDDYEDIDDNDNSDSSEDDDDYEDIDDGEGEPEFDGWGFANSGLDTYAGVNGYYISGKDLDRLTSELTETEKKNLLNSYYYVHNYNKDNSYNMNEYEPWGGSCYGMSMTSILHARGLLSTDELHGSSTLEETTLTKENLSAINYFFWQQNLAPCQTAMQQFESQSAQEQIRTFVSVASSDIPFQIAFFWQDGSSTYGHSVVGYGMETGNWSWQRGDYSHDFNVKILTYDCSYPEDDNNKSAFYLNTTDNSWCYPQYSAWSTTNGITDGIKDNGKLGCILSNIDYIEPVDYQNGYLSETEYNLTEHQPSATVTFEADQSYTVSSTSGKADINGLVVSDSTYGDNIQTSAMLCGKSNTIHVYIPQGEKSYEVSSDEPLNFSLNVGNMLITVDSDKAGTVDFKNDGSLKISSDTKPEDCKISVTSDDEKAFGVEGCQTVNVEKSTSQELAITPGKTGIEISGDDLSELRLNGDIDDSTKEIASDTTGNAVEITTDLPGDNIVVKADSNGDGTYDKTISKTKLPKKTKQKITLKKKKVSVKAGKTAKLKAKAKTKLAYKKTSGNKKISISSSGKIKVNKKLKKGTYKIKVKVTAKASKKYKKATKTFTIKVKIK